MRLVYVINHLVSQSQPLEINGSLPAQFQPTCVSPGVASEEKVGGDTTNTNAGPQKIKGKAPGDVRIARRKENCTHYQIRAGRQEEEL